MVKVILGIILVSVGGGIYLLQRTTGLLMFRIIDFLGLSDTVAGLRTAVIPMPEFVVYSLPGGLWSASYVLLSDALFCQQPLAVRLSWGSLIPLMGVVSELLQMAGLCPGTADWQDLVCYGLPYIVYVICLILK